MCTAKCSITQNGISRPTFTIYGIFVDRLEYVRVCGTDSCKTKRGEGDPRGRRGLHAAVNWLAEGKTDIKTGSQVLGAG